VSETTPTPTTAAERLAAAIVDLDDGEWLMNVGDIRSLLRQNAARGAALEKLRDCDWVISLPDRMDAVRDIAREALK
jgi:hypothetical protein